MSSGFWKTAVDRFNMLWFIMALGLGGTSVAGFTLLNYAFPRPEGLKGLISMAAMENYVSTLSAAHQVLYQLMKVHIGVFAVLHLVVLAVTSVLFVAWRRRHPNAYKALWTDNTRNSVTIAPALSIAMSYNVLFAAAMFYSPWAKANLNMLMPGALVVWFVMLAYTMGMALRIQQTHLERGFDVLKMHFGWLLIPFALSMVGVAGAGIAAMAQNAVIAKTAFLLSLAPFTMAAFLMYVKLMSVFRSQYRLGLPERVEFLPSFFVIIPITTLLAITVFRYGHFLSHNYHGEIPEGFSAFVVGAGWAIELWYAALGLLLLRSYFKAHLFTMKHFDESQWALICPMVALAVLGSFVYKFVFASPVVFWMVVAFLAVDIVVLTWMAARQFMALNARAVEGKALATQTPASAVSEA